MRLPKDTLVAREKLTHYLLRWRPEDDKWAYLAQAGYTQENPERLMADLRALSTANEIDATEMTEYGPRYVVRGTLRGPNGRELRIVTIWLTEEATRQTKFITLFPDKI